MKKGKAAATSVLLAVIALLLSACGGTEPTVTEYGVDGYVYVPQKILIENLQYGISNFQLAGDSLYFSQYTSGVYAIKNLPIGVVEQAVEKWNFKEKGSTVLAVSSVPAKLPENTLETGQEPDYLSLLNVAMDPDRVASSASLMRSMVVEPEMDYCNFYLLSYIADINGGLTFAVSVEAGSYFDMDTAGYILCRLNSDGTTAYQLFLSEYPDFTVDKEGRTFLLNQEGICILDETGKSIQLITPGGYQYASSVYQRSLYGDGENAVYYLNYSTGAISQLTKLDGKFQLEDLKGFLSQGNAYYAIPGGGLLCSNNIDGTLYQWDPDSASTKLLMKWQDSDLIGSYIHAIAPASSDQLIAMSNDANGGMYLLTKTPVEELPEKEILVLASLYPSYSLIDEITEFNRINSEYRVILERYGASGYTAEDDSEAIMRLDATLASDNPPDLLDLSSLDIYKYTNQNALEDLTPHLAANGFAKEDFLENVLDSFTIDGKLVCVPTGLYINGFFGRASMLGALDSWTMEDLYRLTEQNPDMKLFNSTSRYYALQNFSATYYLEKFINWEEGTCSFDSPEFRQLILWIEQCFPEDYGVWLRSDQHIPEDVLLEAASLYNFLTPLQYEARFGEEIQLVGFPSAEGNGKVGYTLLNALGITSNSNHKEGARRFLKYHLAKNEAANYVVTYGSFFPTRKSLLKDRMEIATEEMYVMIGEDGNPVEEYGKVTRFEYEIDGETIGYEAVPQRLSNALLSALNNLDVTPMSDAERLVIRIVTEEAASYYNGDKPLEEVAEIIQSRVQILVQENTLAH